jgi:hypothetical protein
VKGPVCNGFRIRGLNADCDRLALQSNLETTWPLGRGSMGRGPKGKWYDVALGHSELKVLKGYGASCPEFEIAPQGEPGGMLLIEISRRHTTRGVRVGSKMVVQLDVDEAAVVRIEGMMTPAGPLDHSPHAPE